MTDTSSAPATPSGESPAERLARIHTLLGEVLSSATSHDVLELAMAVSVSQRLTPRETPPVWLMFVGPPSLGKTAGADALRDTEAAGLTRFVNNMSRAALDSGLVEKGQKAPWLLAELDGRCWINTELNALLNEDDRAVQKVMGTLTAAFDGSYSKAVGTATGSASSIRRVTSRFSIVGCVTPETLAKHSDQMRNLGPRFLMYRVPLLGSEEEARGFDLVRDPERRRPELMKSLRAEVRAHLLDVLARAETMRVTLPMEQERVLELLSRIIVAGRTSVWKERETGELVLGEPEGPFRVYQQLRSLLIALAYVHGTVTPTPRALRLVRDVALSSVSPMRAEVLLAHRQAPAVAIVEADGEKVAVFGLTAAHLADATGWSRDRAERALKELDMVGLYEPRPGARIQAGSGGGPRPRFYVPVQGLAVMLAQPFEALADDLSNVSPIDARWLGLLRSGLDRISRGEPIPPPPGEVRRLHVHTPSLSPRETGESGQEPAPHVRVETPNSEGSDPYALFDRPCPAPGEAPDAV